MRKFQYFCALIALSVSCLPGWAVAVQETTATVKGKVEFDENRSESWDKQKLVVPFEDIKTSLFERVQLPPVPFPKDWETMNPQQRQAWATEFDASEEGKKFVERRRQLLEQAKSFEVKIEENGNFVVYDVPPGVYGLQGRVDKDLEGTKFGFEVFGQIEVLKDVEEVVLDPIQVAVTPLLERNQTAPPIAVQTHDGKTTLTLDDFQGEFVFVNFWITSSPSAVYQEQIQQMFADLKDQQPIRLLSICVDDDRKQALDFIVNKELREGSHGFTEGLYHRTLFDFGVRTIPSFWLISPDRKIAMSQFEIAQALRTNQQLGEIIANRILGKDEPTPASNPNDANPTTAGSDKKTN